MDYRYDPVPAPKPEELSEAERYARAEAYFAAMQSRRSIRDFSDRPVSRTVIETCIRAAGTAPSGANHQPWHFACVGNPSIKREIRLAAEEEERAFYAGKAGNEWLQDLSPLGTDAQKPFLEIAPWLIAVFAERYRLDNDGSRQKNYYVPESVGIATGMLLSALHQAGLATLTHTPNPMKFLNRILSRPGNERPTMLIVVGHADEQAMIPRAATIKKPLDHISSFIE